MEAESEIKAFLSNCVTDSFPNVPMPLKWDDHLLAVGLDSLQLATLELKIMDRYPELKILPGFCYNNSTLNKIVSSLLDLQHQLATRPKSIMKSYEFGSNSLRFTLPMSHSQRRCLFTSHRHLNVDLSESIVAQLTSTTAVTETKLTQALNAVLMRNTALRSGFINLHSIIYSGTESFFILSMDYGIPTVDEARQVSIEITSNSIGQIPLRFGCIKSVGEIGKRLYANFHNIVADGKSIQLFLRQFFSALCDPDNFQRRTGTAQYFEFVLQEQAFLFNPKFLVLKDNSLKYWLEKLTGIEGVSRLAKREFSMLSDDIQVLDQSDDAILQCLMKQHNRLHYSISAEVAVGLKKLSKNCGVTPFAIMVTTFRLLLYKMFGLHDAILGLPVDCRRSLTVDGIERRDFSDTIGQFLNICLLRCPIENSKIKVEDFIKANSFEIQASLSHAQIPFDEIISAIRKSDKSSNIGEEELFQIAVIHDVLLPTELSSDESFQNNFNFSIGPVNRDAASPQYSMMWHFSIDGQLHVNVNYDSNLFPEVMLHSMIRRYATLCNIVANCNRMSSLTMKELSLLGRHDINRHKQLIASQLGTSHNAEELIQKRKRSHFAFRSVNSYFMHNSAKFSGKNISDISINRKIISKHFQCSELPSPIPWLVSALEHSPSDKIVVEDEATRLTAGELVELSAELSDLIGEKVMDASEEKSGSIIAVHHRRNANLIAIILGVFRTGAAVLPISNDWPVAKIRDALIGIDQSVMLITDRDEDIWTSQFSAQLLMQKAKNRRENKQNQLKESTQITKFTRAANARSSLSVPNSTAVSGRGQDFATRSVYGTFNLKRDTLARLSKRECARTLANSRIISQRTESLNRLSTKKFPKDETTDDSLNTNTVNDSLRNYCANDVLYITFSSGSTGQPKAIATEAASASQLILNYTTTFLYDFDSVVYQVVNYAFDIFFADLLVAIANGARLRLAATAIPCVDELAGCTHAYIMPAFLVRMRDDIALRQLANLQAVLFGGEPIAEDWLALAVSVGVRLIQLFGFTEATVYSSYQRFNLKNIMKKLSFYNIKNDSDLKILKSYLAKQKAKIGRPFLSVYLFAVDSDYQVLPVEAIGAEGFLCVGGPTVASGYVGSMSSHNARVFHQDSAIGLRYFRTNDRVQLDADGSLRFLGRSDEFMKIRGHLVLIPEMERLYSQLLSNIGQCVVKIIGDEVILFVEPKSNYEECLIKNKNFHAELIDRLEAEYPPHLIPNRLIFVPKFWLNSNGKIDRKALEAIVFDPVNSRQNDVISVKNDNTVSVKYDCQANELIDNVCQVFAKTIGISRLAPTENIFEQGADSLKILIICQELKQKFHVILHIDDVFKYKTVAKMMTKATRHENTETGNASKLLSAKTNFSNLQLSYNQEHLWFLDRLNGQADDSYHISIALRFYNDLNKDRFKYAVNRLIQDNAVLRTIIDDEDGSEISLKPVILSGTESYVYLRYNETNNDSTNRHLIDLSKDIPLRVDPIQLFQSEIGPNSSTEKTSGYLFKVVLHHVAVDGWSLALICQQLINSYRKSDVEVRTCCSSPIAMSYAEFALKQRTQTYETELAFWCDELSSVKNCYIPIDREPNKGNQEIQRDESNEFEMNSTLEISNLKLIKNMRIKIIDFDFALEAEKLNQFLSTNSCSMTQLFLAAYVLSLAREGDNKQCGHTVGIAFANRDETTRHVVGYFANVNAVRLASPSNDESAAEFVADVRRQLSRFAAHAHVPFELVVRALNPRRRPARNPIFQTTFAYDNEDVKEIIGLASDCTDRQHDFNFSAQEFNLSSAKFDQCWRIFDIETNMTATKFKNEKSLKKNFRARIEYNSMYFRPDTIKVAAKMFEKALNFIATADETLKIGTYLKAQSSHPLPTIVISAPEPELNESADLILLPNTSNQLTIDIPEIVTSVWAQVLGLPEEEIGPDDNFFDLGGHSLLIGRVSTLLSRRLAVHCELASIFEYQTIVELSDFLRRLRKTADKPVDEISTKNNQHYLSTVHSSVSLSAERTVNRDDKNIAKDTVIVQIDPACLSTCPHFINDDSASSGYSNVTIMNSDDARVEACRLQYSLLRVYLNANSARRAQTSADVRHALAYTIPIALRFRHGVDVKRLRASIRAFICRHAAWRTIFKYRNDSGNDGLKFFQRILPEDHEIFESHVFQGDLVTHAHSYEQTVISEDLPDKKISVHKAKRMAKNKLKWLGEKIFKSSNAEDYNGEEEESEEISQVDPNLSEDVLFNPFFAPPLRLRLNGDILRIDVSHLIFDGASVRTFADELLTMYNADEMTPNLKLNTSELESQKVYQLSRQNSEIAQLSNYERFSLKFNTECDARRQIMETFWKDIFMPGITPNPLMPVTVIDSKYTESENSQWATYRFDLLARSIATVCKRERCAPLSVCLFAFGKVLQQRMSSFHDDFFIGTAVDMRQQVSELESRVQYDDEIGLFVNTLPIPYRVRSTSASIKSGNWKDELKMLNSTVQQIISQNSFVIYDQLLKLAHVDKLFDAMLVLDRLSSGGSPLKVNEIRQNAKIAQKLLPEDLEILNVTPPVAKFGITLFVGYYGEDVELRVEYDTQRFETEFINAMAKTWAYILRQMSSAHNSTLNMVTLLPEERFFINELSYHGDDILFGATGVNCNESYRSLNRKYDSSASFQLLCTFDVMEAIAVQTDRTPDRVALETPRVINAVETSVTYEELSTILRRLSIWIRRRVFMATGEPQLCDRPIAVLGQRCNVKSVLLSLAVMYAGGAYLPIDVDANPSARIRAILHEARVHFCVTAVENFNFNELKNFANSKIVVVDSTSEFERVVLETLSNVNLADGKRAGRRKWTLEERLDAYRNELEARVRANAGRWLQLSDADTPCNSPANNSNVLFFRDSTFETSYEAKSPPAASKKSSTVTVTFRNNGRQFNAATASSSNGSDLAYVIFTSGTSGTPKGVAIERRAVANMVVAATRRFAVDADSCVYQFTNFAFDNSVLEIFTTLCNGARLFIDDAEFGALIADCRASAVEPSSYLTDYQTESSLFKAKSNQRNVIDFPNNYNDKSLPRIIINDWNGDNTNTNSHPYFAVPESLEEGENNMSHRMVNAKNFARVETKARNRPKTAFFCARRFCAQIAEFGLTHAFLYPALVEIFDDAQMSTLARLRLWISGAERLPATLLSRALRAGVHVAQCYGPTELTCYCLSRQLRAGDDAQNLGRPIPGSKITVRTPSGDPALPYTAHTLYVGGEGLMRGYVNRIAEKQPFKWFDGTRYYCTGDMVKRLPNGEILFVGRSDAQIKMRGFRVEPGEIEAALCAAVGVRAAKVIAAPTRAQNDVDLIAYICVDTSASAWCGERQIRAFCRQRLPYYMVPRRITAVDEMPLTSNAKIDVRRLSAVRLHYVNEDSPKHENKFKESRSQFNTSRSLTESKSVDDRKERKISDSNLLKLCSSNKNKKLATADQLETNELSEYDNQEPKVAQPGCLSENRNAERQVIYENVLQIITEILELDFKDLQDCGFIYLGGNSLNGQRVVNRLYAVYDLPENSLLLADLLDVERTLNEFAVMVTDVIQLHRANKISSISLNCPEVIPSNYGVSSSSQKHKEINQFRITDIVNYKKSMKLLAPPLSHQQAQMWYLAQVDPHGTYVLPLVQKFTHTLDVRRLQAAILRVAQRQAVLRTVLSEWPTADIHDDNMRQEILSGTESFHSFVSLDRDTVVASIDDLPNFSKEKVQYFGTQTFDLSIEIPLKCQLFRADDGEFVAVLLIHHAACDAASTQLLETEILREYQTADFFCNNSNCMLVANQYAIWSATQRNVDVERQMREKAKAAAHCLTDAIDNALNIQEIFYGENDELKTKAQPLVAQNYDNLQSVESQIEVSQFSQYIGQTKFQIPVANVRDSRLTAYEFFAAALWATVGQFVDTSARDKFLVIGGPSSNRRSSDVENTIGNFLTNTVMTLPMAIVTNNKISIDELAAGARAAARNAFVYADVPFDVLIEALRAARPALHRIGANLYDIFYNCRYELEDERQLRYAPELVIADRYFTDMVINEWIRAGDERLKHFVEIDVDQIGDHFEVVLRVSLDFFEDDKSTAALNAKYDKLLISQINASCRGRPNRYTIATFSKIFVAECRRLATPHNVQQEKVLRPTKNDHRLATITHSAIAEALSCGNNVDALDMTRSFFALGGSSLLLLRLRRRLESELAVELDVSELIRCANTSLACIVGMCERKEKEKISKTKSKNCLVNDKQDNEIQLGSLTKFPIMGEPITSANDVSEMRHTVEYAREESIEQMEPWKVAAPAPYVEADASALAESQTLTQRYDSVSNVDEFLPIGTPTTSAKRGISQLDHHNGMEEFLYKMGQISGDHKMGDRHLNSEDLPGSSEKASSRVNVGLVDVEAVVEELLKIPSDFNPTDRSTPDSGELSQSTELDENNSQIVFVFFHALIAGHLSYAALCPALTSAWRSRNRTLRVFSIHHPDTFGSNQAGAKPPRNSLAHLAEYYSSCLEYFLQHGDCRFDKASRMIFIGASLGATLAYECAAALANWGSHYSSNITIISIDGSAEPPIGSPASMNKTNHERRMLTVIQHRDTSEQPIETEDIYSGMIENSWHLLQLRQRHGAFTKLIKGRAPFPLILLTVDCDSTDRESFLGWPSVSGVEILRVTSIAGDHTTMLDSVNCPALANEILASLKL